MEVVCRCCGGCKQGDWYTLVCFDCMEKTKPLKPSV